MYTITLKELIDNPLITVFPENYPFYTDDTEVRKLFEEKFIKHYQHREIGFETAYLFTEKLYDKLLLNMDYWTQLYETYLKSKDIEFLLNKDLKETTTHTLSSDTKGNGAHVNYNQGVNESNQKSTNNESSTGELSHQESMLRDGVANVELANTFLTGKSKDSSNSSSNGNQTITQDNSLTTKENGNTTNSESVKVTESTTLISQGNIGITSSAELLEKWREVLINMDKIIIDECADLFLRIY